MRKKKRGRRIWRGKSSSERERRRGEKNTRVNTQK